MGDTRIEHDSMGEVAVPASALWGAQTQRAVQNFPVSGSGFEPALVVALARVKKAAALANAELGVLEDGQAAAIVASAEQIVAGRHLDHFPIDVFQTGSGTSTNMNMNEVISRLSEVAGTPVHPNDHVNASQSSNDTFPTAIHIAAAETTATELLPALEVLHSALSKKAGEFAGVVKAGRTHLMDATPVMLGQEFAGYASIVKLAGERLGSTLPRVCELPLGGTAVGTGINTPVGFTSAALAHLNSDTHNDFTEARDHFEAQGSRDALVELSGQLRTIAVGLIKICNDLRWMGSGPAAGLGEVQLPDLQPGSSIMPGKVNPVIPEATLMVCAQVIGNDAAITYAGSSGNFELNVMMPVIAHNLLESIRLLTNSSQLLAERCVSGIQANVEQLRRYAESSPSVVTPLNASIGYERAAEVAKKALAAGITIREQVIEMGLVDEGVLTIEELDAALNVEAMTTPSVTEAD